MNAWKRERFGHCPELWIEKDGQVWQIVYSGDQLCLLLRCEGAPKPWGVYPDQFTPIKKKEALALAGGLLKNLKGIIF